MEKTCDELLRSKRIRSLCGAFAGMLAAALLTQPLRFLPAGWGALGVSAGVYAALIAVGWRAGRREKALTHDDGEQAPSTVRGEKVLDTSVLIDGRILDICKAGFLEGELVIPTFVLDELRHIADSADSLRRSRGRRGLDIVARLQEEAGQAVRIEESEEDAAEVDVRLLRLAKERNAAVLTNDYNLNKVAGVTGVRVLNINELAGALRPVVLPGEEMSVRLIRDGKEPGQGVAYLDDGTMVVVENGKHYVGEVTDVVVTTVLQTSAGRMIFGRVKGRQGFAV